MSESSVHLDPALLDDLLNSPDGPVGLVIAELSDKAAAVARTAAPVMQRKNFSRWGKTFDPIRQYGPPGATKESIRSSFPRFNPIGQLYGGVNVNYGSTLFLEHPARQIHSREYMFMTDALDALSL